jgi:hypothetical protein
LLNGLSSSLELAPPAIAPGGSLRRLFDDGGLALELLGFDTEAGFDDFEVGFPFLLSGTSSSSEEDTPS